VGGELNFFSLCINMATIATNSHGNFTNAPRRSYIAMSSYTNDFFGYSLVFDPTTFSNVGRLSTLGVPATSTLRGSILSETGKKLYPSANAGVSTLMVSVFDQTSLLTGYINPNSPAFAILTTDKPPYMGQGTDPGTNMSTNLGNSIYTHGSVIADGFGTYSGLLSTGQSLNVGTTARIGASLSTGTFATVGTTLSVGQSISSGTVVIAPSTFTSHMFVSTIGGAAASIGTGTLSGGAATIATTAVTASSKIFLTNISNTNLVRINGINAGVNFSVAGSGSDSFNWLIIN
jgi:hypothetical protein